MMRSGSSSNSPATTWLPTMSNLTTCNFNEISSKLMNDFASKRERRAERFHELAEKHDNISDGRHFAARQQLEMIPPGQPILVGHHSETRHRAQLKRIDRHFAKAKEHHDKARSEEHTSELQSPDHLVCRLLLEQKKRKP